MYNQQQVKELQKRTAEWLSAAGKKSKQSQKMIEELIADDTCQED